jgi:Transposase DNA-binding/Transposase Tn5 dimerisation domain
MKECGSALFGDHRLTKRLVNILTSLFENQEQSLPSSCGSWSETKAAYRFFDNERVTSDEIYASHRRATLERINEQPVILSIQDTTTLNYTLHRATTGLGSIGQSGLSGFFLHTSMALTTLGIPLGILKDVFWVRNQDDVPSKNNPIEQKESYKWIKSLKESTQDIPSSTKVITIGDRESDIYDLFVEASELNQEFIVRASHNRNIKNSGEKLLDSVNAAPVIGQIEITIPRAGERRERIARVEFRTIKATISAPKNRKKEGLPDQTINVIHVCEVDTPIGEKKIEWFLLTNLPVITEKDASCYLRWYSYRWRIERYHYILKSGCKIEELQLETQERLQKAIAVYSIVAWRILWMTYQSRETPDSPCTVILSENEWKALCVYTNKTNKVPSKPPTIKEATRLIAKLGGFLGRRHDGDPGVKVLWRGFRRLEDLTKMWKAMKDSVQIIQ